MFVVPHLILKRGDKIFLSKRSSTQKIWPCHWHCVTGTIEDGESPQAAIIREANEEIALTLLPKDLKLVIVLHVDEKSILNPDTRFYAIELFFECELPAEQEPVNMEPHKQDAIAWFDSLPEQMIPCVKFGLELYRESRTYGEYKSE
jgi:8-oxo-dGTP pyrophosphatase MutT (NUDIX family)